MPGKHRNRVGWVMEFVLIALCLAIFGVLYWMAVGRYEALITPQ